MPKPIRMLQDNVLVCLVPKPKQTRSGLVALPDNVNERARGSRVAEVIASGPGYHMPVRTGANSFDSVGAFVPNQTKPGDFVLVDERAGQNYDFDVSIPRHNKSPEFMELFGDRGEFRVLRESGEVHGVLEGTREEIEQLVLG